MSGAPPLPAPNECEHASRREQQGQELVERDHQQEIIPGLAAADDLLLVDPVTQRADDARADAHAIGEEGGEEHQLDGPEEARRGKPARAQPVPANSQADQGQDTHDQETTPGSGKGEGTAGAIEWDQVPMQYPHRESRQERQDQREQQNQQV